MISNSVFDEGTSLLKQMNSLYRKLKVGSSLTLPKKQQQSPIKEKADNLSIRQDKATVANNVSRNIGQINGSSALLKITNMNNIKASTARQTNFMNNSTTLKSPTYLTKNDSCSCNNDYQNNNMQDYAFGLLVLNKKQSEIHNSKLENVNITKFLENKGEISYQKESTNLINNESNTVNNDEYSSINNQQEAIAVENYATDVKLNQDNNNMGQMRINSRLSLKNQQTYAKNSADRKNGSSGRVNRANTNISSSKSKKNHLMKITSKSKENLVNLQKIIQNIDQFSPKIPSSVAVNKLGSMNYQNKAEDTPSRNTFQNTSKSKENICLQFEESPRKLLPFRPQCIIATQQNKTNSEKQAIHSRKSSIVHSVSLGNDCQPPASQCEVSNALDIYDLNKEEQRSLSKGKIVEKLDKANILVPKIKTSSRGLIMQSQPCSGFSTPQNKLLGYNLKHPNTDIKNGKDTPLTSACNNTLITRDYKWILTEEERSLYGDRFPEDYQKIDFLGRGGFALVWLGVNQDGKKFAIKQMLKNHSTESQLKELYYGEFLFDKNGIPKLEHQKYEGIKNIVSFIETKSTKLDIWFIMELGGSTLSKLIFDIKGEFFKGERVYGIKHLDLYNKFHHNSNYLRSFIYDMANFLHLTSELKIVHSDLKPDNILLEDIVDQPCDKLFKLKIIDFGSAFTFNEQGDIGMATPEYMPPEVLELLSSQTRCDKSSIELLAEICQPWSIDVWSLGAILLEIISGVPLWLSLKCRVETNGKKIMKTGLFAVKGRAYDKIFIKQKNIIENLSNILGESLHGWEDYELLFDLICSMMRWEPEKRISPLEILNHCYITKVKNVNQF